MLGPLALSLRIQLTSLTDRRHVYKDCIASLKRLLKLSLYYCIVNITEFHLDSDYDLCITSPLVKIYWVCIDQTLSKARLYLPKRM